MSSPVMADQKQEEEVKQQVKNGTKTVHKEEEEDEDDGYHRGVGKLWSEVNHIALVVKDVGRSLQFYTDVVGMKQVMRPNFDRHGAWLTFNNVDLHLIKGRPSVHCDDDLIVSHIAIAIDDMAALRKKLAKTGTSSRKNISVPNPEGGGGAVVEQEFVRDPDGYYIEFCNCASLHEFLHSLGDKGEWSMSRAKMVAKASKLLSNKAKESRDLVKEIYARSNGDDGDALDENVSSILSKMPVLAPADPVKLSNLVKRRKVYADITQSVTEKDLEELLERFDNVVPKVIAFLEERRRKRGTITVIPPAFYERDGTLFQPPAFEIPVEVDKLGH